MGLHEHEVTVRAAHHQHDRGDLRLGQDILGLEQPVRVHMALEVVHADEREPRREGEPAGVVRAHEEAADEPRPDGRRDRVHLPEGDTRVAQRGVGDRVDRAQVLPRRDLGHDAAGGLMRELGADHVRADAAAILDDRDARLIAARLDREDPHSPRSSSLRSTPSRSRTARSFSRSVHMMSASSLLSL